MEWKLSGYEENRRKTYRLDLTDRTLFAAKNTFRQGWMFSIGYTSPNLLLGCSGEMISCDFGRNIFEASKLDSKLIRKVRDLDIIKYRDEFSKLGNLDTEFKDLSERVFQTCELYKDTFAKNSLL